MSLIIALALTPSLMLISAFVVAVPITLLQIWEEWSERRKCRKQLHREYDEWYGRYLSCDNFAGAVDKGKAAAMCVVLRAMIEEEWI